jgi:hypothetical protein
LGLVVFARRDYAEEVISQNFGQFEALYEPYRITWSRPDVLRLVAWLLLRAGIPVFANEAEILQASYETLRKSLASFWGEKLGPPGSKEAYTDRWVMAALSDLNGRMQPRDIVRLLHFACKNENKPNALSVSPLSLRDAIEECAPKRIKEMREETPSLASLFTRLQNADTSAKYIPFRADAFALSREEQTILEREGVITTLNNDQDYYMPEIVRQGLGFRLRGGARAKVLTLLSAAQNKGRSRRDE